MFTEGDKVLYQTGSKLIPATFLKSCDGQITIKIRKGGFGYKHGDITEVDSDKIIAEKNSYKMKHIKLFEDVVERDSGFVDDELAKERKEKITRLNNPLNMKNKISARRWIYKISQPIINPPGQSMFRDESWEPVTKLFRKWNEEGVDWDFYENPRYFNFPMTDSMNLPRKEWYITIKWFNDKGRESELMGTLVAAFDGPKDDPTERYDLTLVI